MPIVMHGKPRQHVYRDEVWHVPPEPSGRAFNCDYTGGQRVITNCGVRHLKFNYSLERGRQAITIPKASVENIERAPRSCFTTVAGVTFEGRQRIIGRCPVGERLVLVRDSQNKYDKGAIKVLRANGEQLGFLPAHVSRGEDSSGLAYQMDRGDRYECRLKDITGGGPGKSLGVNIDYRN